jgi:hypothetical protein
MTKQDDLAAVLNQYGATWSHNWADLDGKTIRDDMQSLVNALRENEDVTPRKLRKALNLCQLGEEHWDDQCEEEHGGNPPEPNEVLKHVSIHDVTAMSIKAWEEVHKHPATASCECVTFAVLQELLARGYTITKGVPAPAPVVIVSRENEPPVGTWVRDSKGGVSQRQEQGWGEPGVEPYGKWTAMWDARGPYELCGPWGADLPSKTQGTL